VIKEEKRLDLDKKLAASSGWERFRLITGGLCFIVGATLVLIHLGFVKDSSVSIDFEQKPIQLQEQTITVVKIRQPSMLP